MSSPLWTIHNNRTQVTMEDLSTEQALAVLRAEQPTDLQNWFAWREGMQSWNPVVTLVELDLAVPSASVLKKTPRIPANRPVVQITPAPVDTEEPVQLTTASSEQLQLAVPETSPSRVPSEYEGFEIYWMSDADPLRADFANFAPDQGTPAANLTLVTQDKEKSGYLEQRRHPRIEIRLLVTIQNADMTFRAYSRNASLGGVALEVAIPPVLGGQGCQIYLTEMSSGEMIHFPGRFISNRDQVRHLSFLRATEESILQLKKWLQTIAEIKKAV